MASTKPLLLAGSAACALATLAAGLLDGFSVHVEAYIGGGDSQRTFEYDRTFSLLSYGHARYIAVLVAAGAALVAAGWALRARSAWPPLATMLAAALVGLSLFAAEFEPDAPGVRGCASASSCGGAFLSPAVDELMDAARSRPEARHHEYNLLRGYRASPEIGWSLTSSALYVLLGLSGVALGRRAPALVRSAVPAAAAIAIVLVLAVPGADCGGDGTPARDPDTNPLGLLAIGLALACAAVGLGSLTRRRGLAGPLALAGGLVLAGVSALLLAGKDCSFY